MGDAFSFLVSRTDHDRPRPVDHGADGSRVRRFGRPGVVEQRARRHLRAQVLPDVAVQAARVLQLERGRQDTETSVRNQHHREDQLHEHVRRRQHGGTCRVFGFGRFPSTYSTYSSSSATLELRLEVQLFLYFL